MLEWCCCDEFATMMLHLSKALQQSESSAAQKGKGQALVHIQIPFFFLV
jgi:hypothetical protein